MYIYKAFQKSTATPAKHTVVLTQKKKIHWTGRESKVEGQRALSGGSGGKFRSKKRTVRKMKKR
jgi:hypothetical protein